MRRESGDLFRDVIDYLFMRMRDEKCILMLSIQWRDERNENQFDERLHEIISMSAWQRIVVPRICSAPSAVNISSALVFCALCRAESVKSTVWQRAMYFWCVSKMLCIV